MTFRADGGVRGQVRVWDVESLACLATLQGHSGAVRALAASPDRVFSGSDDTTIKARPRAPRPLSGLFAHAHWQRLFLRPPVRTVWQDTLLWPRMRGGAACPSWGSGCLRMHPAAMLTKWQGGVAGVGQPHAAVPAHAGGP